MRLLFIVLALTLARPISGFDYFGGKIDYWNQKKQMVPENPVPLKPATAKENKKSFDWNKYSDPKNDEFFQEGNYKPPKAFMELARNPTDENIKRWHAMMETKNKLMRRLHEHMSNYLAKNGNTMKKEEKAELIRSTNNLPRVPKDINRFRFRLYFDSSCHHCERMMATAKDLQNMGYYVEAKQIDRKPPKFKVPFVSTYADPKEVKAKKITAWPVLFVGDTNKQLVYRIQGYQPTASVIQALSKK